MINLTCHIAQTKIIQRHVTVHEIAIEMSQTVIRKVIQTTL